MTFSLRQTDELVRIAAAGGGIKMAAGVRQADDLIRIAAAASTKGGRVTFTGMANRLGDELIRIAAAGKGCVSFED